MVDISGASLHCIHEGVGEPLLLIPGLGMESSYFNHVLPHLARHFAVYAIDPRGIGKSTKTPPPYSVEGWADDFAAFIDAVGKGPMHVLGSSLGGATTLALGVRHPTKVKSLIPVGAFSELDRAAELNFNLRLRLIRKLGMGDEVADYMGLWTMSREFINSEKGYAVMRANQANIKKNSVELYSAFIECLLRWARCLPGQEGEPKFTSQLSKICAPTLVITSENDHLIPVNFSELIAAKVPGAQLHVLPGGHIPFMEQPDKVARLIIDFIQSPH
jgi:pimeloyl-ACP methyl ester carboxylesterase